MDRSLACACRRHIRHSGFTLLEVLVALAVLAIALTSIYKLQGQTILMSANSRFLTIAPELAQAKLSEAERQDFKDITDNAGDFGEDYPNYAWTLSTEEVPTELITDNKYHLIRIDINVTQNNENNFQLHTYRFYTD